MLTSYGLNLYFRVASLKNSVFFSDSSLDPMASSLSNGSCYNRNCVTSNTDALRRLTRNVCKEEMKSTSDSIVTSDVIIEGGVYRGVKKQPINVTKASSFAYSNATIEQLIEPNNKGPNASFPAQRCDNISKERKSDRENTKEVICADYKTKYDQIYGVACQNTCSICGKTLSTCQALKIHERIHTGERPFLCSVCNKSFTQCNTLKVHKRIHSGERPYSCFVCSKTFIQRSDLTKHLRIHSGERPFACSVCSKSFSASNDLTKHERVHCKLRLFACSFCSKVFSFNSQLQAHEPIHNGKRPYECSVCYKTFLSNSNLKTHERIHYQESRCPPEIFTINFSTQSFSPENGPLSLPIELSNALLSTGNAPSLDAYCGSVLVDNSTGHLQFSSL